MIVIRMQPGISGERATQVAEHLSERGYVPSVVEFGPETLFVLPDVPSSIVEPIATFREVADVAHVSVPYPLVSRDLHPVSSTVCVGNVTIGGDGEPVIIAGPCSVESETQIHAAAEAALRAGAHILRGGAFKPRTNPYSFQGLGAVGLKLLREAGRKVGLPVVTEVMSPSDVDLVSEYADMLQIGARNMANFSLLRAVGESDRPVLLKRGLAATVDEWLQAAEYIVSMGNPHVVLCERGIRGFDPATRNTLDLAGAVLAKQKSHLPVIVDPSHGTGVVSLIGPMSLAAVAAGLDGLSLEMHPHPAEALSDRDQALTPDQLRVIVAQVRGLSSARKGTKGTDGVKIVPGWR